MEKLEQRREPNCQEVSLARLPALRRPAGPSAAPRLACLPELRRPRQPSAELRRPRQTLRRAPPASRPPASAVEPEAGNGRQRRDGRGGVGADEAEPGGEDGQNADEGSQLQGRARHRAIRPDTRALAQQGPELIPTLFSSANIRHWGRRWAC